MLALAHEAGLSPCRCWPAYGTATALHLRHLAGHGAADQGGGARPDPAARPVVQGGYRRPAQQPAGRSRRAAGSRPATSCGCSIPMSIRRGFWGSTSPCRRARGNVMNRMSPSLDGARPRPASTILGKPHARHPRTAARGVPVLDVARLLPPWPWHRVARGGRRSGGVMRLPRPMSLAPARDGCRCCSSTAACPADDPRRRADRRASPRVPARSRPRGRFRDARRRPGPAPEHRIWLESRCRRS